MTDPQLTRTLRKLAELTGSDYYFVDEFEDLDAELPGVMRAVDQKLVKRFAINGLDERGSGFLLTAEGREAIAGLV